MYIYIFSHKKRLRSIMNCLPFSTEFIFAIIFSCLALVAPLQCGMDIVLRANGDKIYPRYNHKYNVIFCSFPRIYHTILLLALQENQSLTNMLHIENLFQLMFTFCLTQLLFIKYRFHRTFFYLSFLKYSMSIRIRSY